MLNFKKFAMLGLTLCMAAMVFAPAAKAEDTFDLAACKTACAGDETAIKNCEDDCDIKAAAASVIPEGDENLSGNSSGNGNSGAANSGTLESNIWGGGDVDVQDLLSGEQGVGFGKKDPREMIASIIKVVLGFLGIVAVVIILIGGFKWMTAGGNEDQVGEAKKWIYSGVVGLLIILSAYALASWVLTQLTTKIV